MGIEELERLVAEGIQLGLKGAELRRWVDDERARLKAQREAERLALKYAQERLREEREAERLALKCAQEKELAKLKQQLAFLENMLQRKAEEASLVRETSPSHKKFEHICEAASERNVSRLDVAESASHERFRNDLEQDRKLFRDDYFGTEKQSFELRSKITHEKYGDTLHQSGCLFADGAVTEEIGKQDRGADNSENTQTDTTVCVFAKGNETPRNVCYQLPYSRPKRESRQSFPEMTKVRQRNCKAKTQRRLSLNTSAKKLNCLRVEQNPKQFRRKISLPFFLKRRILLRKADMLKRCRICFVDVRKRTVPRQPRDIRSQIGSLRRFADQLFSCQKPNAEKPKNSAQLHRFYCARKCITGTHDKKKTEWFRMNLRSLKIPRQFCWKYRRKEAVQNPLATHGQRFWLLT